MDRCGILHRGGMVTGKLPIRAPRLPVCLPCDPPPEPPGTPAASKTPPPARRIERTARRPTASNAPPAGSRAGAHNPPPRRSPGTARRPTASEGEGGGRAEEGGGREEEQGGKGEEEGRGGRREGRIGEKRRGEEGRRTAAGISARPAPGKQTLARCNMAVSLRTAAGISARRRGQAVPRPGMTLPIPKSQRRIPCPR